MSLKLALCLLHTYLYSLQKYCRTFFTTASLQILDAQDLSEIVKVQCSFNKLQQILLKKYNCVFANKGGSNLLASSNAK